MLGGAPGHLHYPSGPTLFPPPPPPLDPPLDGQSSAGPPPSRSRSRSRAATPSSPRVSVTGCPGWVTDSADLFPRRIRVYHVLYRI
ncbi:hypothetical protein OPV22_034918 [Ensete ventricosum]|uniref:Uncharacterized protein n=1 Tax=Ensete ventricosum TaxID=4639 RepID=A0AAV8PSW5_ENSVE|nr:hypothetical protein OPV22_034918 [Ensete ventricosum]